MKPTKSHLSDESKVLKGSSKEIESPIISEQSITEEALSEVPFDSDAAEQTTLKTPPEIAESELKDSLEKNQSPPAAVRSILEPELSEVQFDSDTVEQVTVKVTPETTQILNNSDLPSAVNNIKSTQGSIGYTRPNIAGAFDLCGPIFFTGWLFDKNHPGMPLDICIFSDGNIIHQGPANIFRDDLVKAGIGNGKHGFSALIPDALFDGITHQIEIREVRTGFLLPNSPSEFRGHLLSIQEVKLEGTSLVGKLLLVNSSVVADNILVYENEELIAKGETWSVSRSATTQEFVINLPLSVFDGRAH